MLQRDRTYLFNVSYALDNHKRIKGAHGQLFVVFTHEEMEKHALDLRNLAAADEERIGRGDKTK